MIDKEDDKTNNSEDKDYGFPFVEVKPLGSISASNEKAANKKEEEKPDTSHISSSKTEEEKPIAANIKFKTEVRKERKRKNQLPLLLSLVFLIIIILGSLAYFLYYLPENETSIQESPQITESIEAEVLDEPEVNVIDDADEIIESENERIASEPESKPIITESQPIVEKRVGQLTLVEKRSEVPIYNLIVASSPNERIARAEAQKIIDNGRDVWIIFPFGNTNNYRISVGRYGDLESATEALESVKVELNESSWILKY